MARDDREYIEISNLHYEYVRYGVGNDFRGMFLRDGL